MAGSARSRVVFVLFFAIGFVALGAEVLWVRYLGLLINNTVYTYTLTLSVVLIGLVLGSILAAQFSDKTDMTGALFWRASDCDGAYCSRSFDAFAGDMARDWAMICIFISPCFCLLLC